MVEVSARRRTSIAAHQRSAREAARHLLHALDDVTRAHEASVLHGDQPEALHDLRIDLRRARSILHGFRQVFPADRLRPLQDGLRWLGGLTGEVRDLDVLLERLDAARAKLPSKERAALEPLFSVLRDDRARARAALVMGLESERHRRLVAAWRRMTAETPPDGRTAAAGLEGEVAASPDARRRVRTAGDRPVREVASAAVARAWRRLERRGGAISDSSTPGELHRVRIDAKKLRYLLEMLQPFYSELTLEPSIARLRKLQDCLGDLHDACTEQEALRSLASRAGALDGAPSPQLLLATGRLLERSEGSAARAREKFPKRFDRVMKGESRRCVDALVDGA
jgi:CHAD domain-containing protein